jgi:hypothetical protein
VRFARRRGALPIAATRPSSCWVRCARSRRGAHPTGAICGLRADEAAARPAAAPGVAEAKTGDETTSEAAPSVADAGRSAFVPPRPATNPVLTCAAAP